MQQMFTHLMERNVVGCFFKKTDSSMPLKGYIEDIYFFVIYTRIFIECAENNSIFNK